MKIAVIGGGAKAAALAVRANILRSVNVGTDIHVVIFEQATIGANWSGASGYTDGQQFLCTPVERDLGYPYSPYPERVSRSLFTEYSWQAFLLSEAGQEHGGYRDWVDGGRRPPSHILFSKYLRWAVDKSGALVRKGQVVSLTPKEGKWRVHYLTDGRNKASTSRDLFDGIVVTGPGTASRVKTVGSSARVFDGMAMWRDLPKVERALNRLRTDDPITIVGAGGTAAAILAWLIRRGQQERHISIVASQPAFFTRGDSVFENRLFNDDDAWQRLSSTARQTFGDRLNRGVVWDSVMSQVSTAKRVRFHYGKATEIRAVRGGMEVSIKSSKGEYSEIDASLVFDAAGFDPWWWLKLLPNDYFPGRDKAALIEELQPMMSEQLRFQGASWTLPPLHAPMLASQIGPGFGSLMSLGAMAERVLSTYLTGHNP